MPYGFGVGNNLEKNTTKSSGSYNFGIKKEEKQEESKEVKPMDARLGNVLSNLTGNKVPDQVSEENKLADFFKTLPQGKITIPDTLGGPKLGFEFKNPALGPITDADKALARDISDEKKREIRGGSFEETNMEVDHIIPVSLGGTRPDYNLQALSNDRTQQEGKVKVEWYNIERFQRGEITQGEAIYNILQWQWGDKEKRRRLENLAEQGIDPEVFERQRDLAESFEFSSQLPMTSGATTNNIVIKDEGPGVGEVLLSPLDFLHRTGLQMTSTFGLFSEFITTSVSKATGDEALKNTSYGDLWKQSWRNTENRVLGIGSPFQAFKPLIGEYPDPVTIPELEGIYDKEFKRLVEIEKRDNINGFGDLFKLENQIDLLEFNSSLATIFSLKFAEEWANPLWLFDVKGVTEGSFKRNFGEKTIYEETLQYNPAKKDFLIGGKKGTGLGTKTYVKEIPVKRTKYSRLLSESGKEVKPPKIKQYITIKEDGSITIKYTNSGGEILTPETARKVTTGKTPNYNFGVENKGITSNLNKVELKTPQYLAERVKPLERTVAVKPAESYLHNVRDNTYTSITQAEYSILRREVDVIPFENAPIDEIHLTPKTVLERKIKDAREISREEFLSKSPSAQQAMKTTEETLSLLYGEDLSKPTTVGDNLIQEARKYKSAEEFVKAQDIVYHGTTKDFKEFDLTKAGTRNLADQGFAGKGIYFTNDIDVAKTFAEGNDIFKTEKGKPRIIESYIDIPELKILSVDNFLELYKKLGLYDLVKGKTVGEVRKEFPDFADRIRKAAQEKGYKAIKVDGGGFAKNGERTFEMVVFDTKDIKTKSQLIDIWNKANKPKKTDTKTTKEVKVPRSQLPVKPPFGRGEKQVSRLAARMKNNLKTLTEEQKANLPEYNKIIKDEQLNRASKYVTNNKEEALSVLKGEMDAPDGLLYNSIARAMFELADLTEDVGLALELTSLRATRLGQELQMLSGMNEMNSAVILSKVKKDRIKALTKADQKTIQKTIKKEKPNLDKALRKTAPKKDAWESFLEEIKC